MLNPLRRQSGRHSNLRCLDRPLGEKDGEVHSVDKSVSIDVADHCRASDIHDLYIINRRLDKRSCAKILRNESNANCRTNRKKSIERDICLAPKCCAGLNGRSARNTQFLLE